MAQQDVDSKAGEVGTASSEAGLVSQNKLLPVAVKKTPLKDLRSENNIAAQKGSGKPPYLKEVAVTEALKVSGVKRSSPEVLMSPSHQQSSSSSGTNGHLVYVRRKSEAEAGKNSNSEVAADNAKSVQPRQLGHREEELRPKSLMKESQSQSLPAIASIPTTSATSIPSERPAPASLDYANKQTAFQEPQTTFQEPQTVFQEPQTIFPEPRKIQSTPSGITKTAQPKVNKQKWEERYLQLQMYLKKLDQSSMEDHVQTLRSLSAVELSQHAVELEKQAIQLSLEQGKELQRVKALNVLGKQVRTPNGQPSVYQQMAQN